MKKSFSQWKWNKTIFGYFLHFFNEFESWNVWYFVLDCILVFSFFKIFRYRRCMAVVSPWLKPFLHILCCLRTFSFPKENFSFWRDKFKKFVLNEGSRQVFMALIYWATPVLQENGQCVALFFKIANQKNILFFGFFSATRENEDGIMSNRRWACYGEFSKFL